MTFNEQYKLMRKQQKAEQKWSAKQVKKQMDFQKMMSDTAHQREMADLKAAGLNPVLTAMGGSGASAPSGASAMSDSIANLIPQALAVADDAVKAVSHSARTVKRNEEEPNTTVNVNTGDNNGNDNNSGVLPIEKSDYDFGNKRVNEIYNQVKDVKIPGYDMTFGQAMVVSNELANLGYETAEGVAEGIANAAESKETIDPEIAKTLNNLAYLGYKDVEHIGHGRYYYKDGKEWKHIKPEMISIAKLKKAFSTFNYKYRNNPGQFSSAKKMYKYKFKKGINYQG